MAGAIIDPQKPVPTGYPQPMPPAQPISQPQYNLTPMYNYADWQIEPQNYMDTFMREYNKLMGGFNDFPQFQGYDVGQAGLGQWSPGTAGLGEYWSDLMGMGVDEITKNLMNPKYSQQLGVIKDFYQGQAQGEQDALMDMYAGMGGRTAPQAAMLSMMESNANKQLAPALKQGALDVWQNAVNNMMGMEQLRSANYSDAMGRELSNADLARLGFEGSKSRELQNADLAMQGYFGAMPYQAALYNNLYANKLGAFNTLSDYLQHATGTDMAAQQQSYGNLMNLAPVYQNAMDINQQNYMADQYANQNYLRDMEQYQNMWGFRPTPGTQPQNPYGGNLSGWLSQ